MTRSAAFGAIFSGGGGGTAPVRDQMANIQTAALRRVFNPAVLSRIANNEFKAADANPLKLSELFPVGSQDRLGRTGSA